MEEFDSNIIIIVGSILAILLLIILYVIIKPKKQFTDDEIYEIKREQDTEVFDENTDIKSL